MAIPRWQSGKESTCQCRRHKRYGFNPRIGKIPWRRKWQPTPMFLPGKFHGQKSLAGYSPWGHEELDTTEQLSSEQHMYEWSRKHWVEGYTKYFPIKTQSILVPINLYFMCVCVCVCVCVCSVMYLRTHISCVSYTGRWILCHCATRKPFHMLKS